MTLALYFENGGRLARDVCGAEDLRGRSNKNVMRYGPYFTSGLFIFLFLDVLFRV